MEKLAKELLVKEVLFKSDLETLIGKRPYEEKKILDVAEEESANTNVEKNNESEQKDHENQA